MMMKRLSAMLLALLLILCAGAPVAEGWAEHPSEGEEENELADEHYLAIRAALDSLGIALDSQDAQAANSAFTELKTSVYSAAKYLAAKGLYNPALMGVCTLSQEALKSMGGDYSQYLSQAYAKAYEVFSDLISNGGGEGGGGGVDPGIIYSGIVSVSVQPAVLSGPGYTHVSYQINMDCDHVDFDAYAGTLTNGSSEIAFKVFDVRHKGDGEKYHFEDENQLEPSRSIDEYIAVYIDPDDYADAEPGTYTGGISFNVSGYNRAHQKGPAGKDKALAQSRDGGSGNSISLTLVIPGVTEYAVTVQALPAEGGSATGTGSYVPNATVSLTAAPNTGWRFVEWRVTPSDVTVTNDQFTMPGGDVAIDAVFEMVEYPIYAIASDGAAVAQVYDGWLSIDEVTVAMAGEELSLALRDGAEPDEGKYFTEEFTLDGVSLGSEMFGGVMRPVAEFTMPAHDLTIGAVQAEREALTLDFTQSAALALHYRAMAELNNDEALWERFGWLEGWDTTLDLDGSGTPDLGVTEPDFETTDYYTLTLLDGADAEGTYTFTYSYMTDRYSPITIIMSAGTPVFGPATLILPADTAVIEESAFEGDASITIVDAGVCAAIGANAFRGCAALMQIRLPKNCQIDDAAFAECGALTVFAPAGGSAEQWANDNGFVFVPISE
ncbi:MAG: hypothetical protein J5602_15180 [Clostridia bacterium]|nr:hypothetical protein [Clostridia bacterium]